MTPTSWVTGGDATQLQNISLSKGWYLNLHIQMFNNETILNGWSFQMLFYYAFVTLTCLFYMS